MYGSRAGLPDPFERAAAVWAIGLAGSDRVAATAATLVAEGATSPALVDIAGRSRGENWFEMRDLIERAFVEMGRPPFDPKSTRVRHAALADYAIDFLAGHRPASEVPALASRLYSADAPDDKLLYDLYAVDSEGSGGSAAALERRTRRASRRFLASFEMPDASRESGEASGHRTKDAESSPRHRDNVRPAPPSLGGLKRSFDDHLARLSLRLLLVALVACVPLSAALCISDLVTGHDPIYTGVFTRQYTVPVKGPDQERGRFTSTDGSITLSDVRLDGASEPSGRADVTYKPTGLLNDAVTGTVSTPSRREFNAVVPWVVFFGSSIVSGIVLKIWLAMRAEKAASHLAPTESPT